MNEIIKKIEAEQLKENVPEFKFTQRSKRVTVKESRSLREQS